MQLYRKERNSRNDLSFKMEEKNKEWKKRQYIKTLENGRK